MIPSICREGCLRGLTTTNCRRSALQPRAILVNTERLTEALSGTERLECRPRLQGLNGAPSATQAGSPALTGTAAYRHRAALDYYPLGSPNVRVKTSRTSRRRRCRIASLSRHPCTASAGEPLRSCLTAPPPLLLVHRVATRTMGHERFPQPIGALCRTRARPGTSSQSVTSRTRS